MRVKTAKVAKPRLVKEDGCVKEITVDANGKVCETFYYPTTSDTADKERMARKLLSYIARGLSKDCLSE